MKRTGFTSVDGDQPHAHAYEIDDYGNGKTVSMVGQGTPHSHTITNKRMSPSGMDNHVHKLMAGKWASEELPA